jgi:hypothetical protein
VSLQDFFAAQARFFDRASDPPAAARDLVAAFPGWNPRPARLEVYARFVRWHVQEVLEKVYPATKDAVTPERWEALVAGYYATKPARAGYDINALGAAFPAFLADVPAWLPPLARLEWAIYATYASTTELPARVERLTINPTLDVLEHAFALCAYKAAPAPRAAPAAGDEVALVWRRPDTGFTSWQSATPRALLALKLAGEGVAVADAAREGGVSVEAVQAALDEAVASGLVLRP